MENKNIKFKKFRKIFLTIFFVLSVIMVIYAVTELIMTPEDTSQIFYVCIFSIESIAFFLNIKLNK